MEAIGGDFLQVGNYDVDHHDYHFRGRNVRLDFDARTGAAKIAAAFTAFSDNPIIFLALINLLLIFVGMFFETSASIIILAPLLTPIAVQLGIDPVHFGMIMIVNLAMGMVTPCGRSELVCRLPDRRDQAGGADESAHSVLYHADRRHSDHHLCTG